MMHPLQSWSGRIVCLFLGLAVCGCETDDPPACEEWRTALALDEEGDLVPFTMREAILDISPVEGSITWSSESPDSIAGTQTRVRIDLEAVEGTIKQVKAKNNAYEGDGAYMCSNGLEAGVAVEVTSEDGQLDETLFTVLRIWPEDGKPGPMMLEPLTLQSSELSGALRFDDPTELTLGLGRGQEGGVVAGLATAVLEVAPSGNIPGVWRQIQLWKLELP